MPPGTTELVGELLPRLGVGGELELVGALAGAEARRAEAVRGDERGAARHCGSAIRGGEARVGGRPYVRSGADFL